MIFPDAPRLRKMIAEAMQEKAPEMYARLKAERKLDQVVADRARAAREQYEEAVSQLGPKETKAIVGAQKAGFLQTVQEWNQRQSRLAEEVLAQALEFPAEQQEATT